MTPLAQLIVKQNLLPVAERSREGEALAERFGFERNADYPTEWPSGWRLYREMFDVHCFDVSEVFGLIDDLAENLAIGDDDTGDLAFLPAPRTWIEHRIKGESRSRGGYLLVQDGPNAFRYAVAGHALVDGSNSLDEYYSFHFCEQPRVPLSGGRAPERRRAAQEFIGSGSARIAGTTPFLYAALAVINAPRVIGRRQHMPHRGLEKKLVAAKSIVGKFPLHAWTEIRLSVAPPTNLTDHPPAEAHLTGARALHFCRAHLRVRRGKLEFVRAHWRGDAALGIKQSRYKMVA